MVNIKRQLPRRDETRRLRELVQAGGNGSDGHGAGGLGGRGFGFGTVVALLWFGLRAAPRPRRRGTSRRLANERHCEALCDQDCSDVFAARFE
jgi:hypothetical protein